MLDMKEVASIGGGPPDFFPEITKNGAQQGIESQHQGRNRRGRGRIGSRRFVPLRLRAVLPFPSAKPQGEKEGSAGLEPFLQQGSAVQQQGARCSAASGRSHRDVRQFCILGLFSFRGQILVYSRSKTILVFRSIE